jgi:pimeloyl-ACP methyl ester carboxylesterase
MTGTPAAGRRWSGSTRLPFLTITALAGVAVLIAGCGGGSSPGAVATATPTPAPTEHVQAVRPLAVIDAPTKVAETAAGKVGYREVGTGSPVLLLMGLGGSMDYWPPSFVATLAANHTVVLLDNSGVGQTASSPAPLTITRMANQTSALISTLGLSHVAVLGWSMGGMIAQALAVLHPAQVSRIVLAATQPGSGHAVPIPAAAAAAAASPDNGAVIPLLFPGDIAAAQTYIAGIIRYPGFYRPSRTAIAAQQAAVAQWMAGRDQAGVRFGAIRLPLLVADGTQDALNPVANDRSLASRPSARLILYPGAGHGFLFQDAASFLPAVEQFLR